MAKKILNIDLEVLGKLNLSTVPNTAGDILTFDGLNQVSRRTASQILSDIGAAALAHNHLESDITDLQAYLLPASINTLLKLNTIVSDATLIDTADVRLSDARTPLSHTHVEADITDLQAYLTSVSISDINATGTADATTYLRGDGSWQVVASGGGTWGSITGTLSAQTDLQGELDAKVDLAGDTMTGDLTIDNGVTQANLLLENGFVGVRQDLQTYKALFGTSTTANNFLVGGSTTGSANSMDTYLRIRSIADGDLQFTENATNHKVYHEGNLDTTDFVAVTGDTMTGTLNLPNLNVSNVATFSGSSTPVRLYGISTGIANVTIVGFYESNGTTRQGYVGFGSGSNSDLYIRNDVSGNQIQIDQIAGENGLLYNGGGGERTVWHEGNRPTIDNMAYKSNLDTAENLDTYLTTGLYHQNSNADSATGSNYPRSYAGMLTVKEGDGFIYQEYQEYQGFRQKWTRQKYLTNWSSWYQHLTTEHFGSSGNWWGGTDAPIIPNISSGGVMEVGRYIDFHNTDTDGTDNTGRFDNLSDGVLRWSSGATTDMIEVYNSSTEFSQLAANASGGYLILSDDSLNNTILRGYGLSEFFAGGIEMKSSFPLGVAHISTQSFHLSSVGGGFYHTTASAVTGTCSIRLPATARNTSDMVSFSIRIYDYAGGDGGGETVDIMVCGYPNTSGGGGWANTNATILTTRLDRDYPIRLSYDGSYHYVEIGGTGNTWSYPQVHVYDVFAGYTADIENWDDGWNIIFTGTARGTTDQTITNNLPTAGRVDLADNEYIYFGNGNDSYIRSNGSDTYWDFRADRDLILRDVSTNRFTFDISSGNLIAANFTLSSDERLKKNIIDIPLDPIDVRWRQFEMIDGGIGKRYGVIAQELEVNYPEFVSEGEDGMKHVAYTDLLVAKMAEKDDEIKYLKKENKELREDIDLIKKHLNIE